MLDEFGKVVFANPAAAGLLGWSMDDLIGRSMHERAMHHGADGEPLRFEDSAVAAVLLDGQPRSLEGEVLWRSSNSALMVDYRVTPVFTAGRVTGAVVVFSDSKLRPDLDAERGGMFDTGVVGMVVLGLDGRFVQVSSAFCDMLGREEDELVGSSFRQVTHPDDVKSCESRLIELVGGEVPAARVELRYLRPDGDLVQVVQHVTLVRGGDAPYEPLSFFVQVLDVTEQRTADEALRRDAERTARIVELCDMLAEGTHEDRELMTDVAQAVARIVGDAVTIWVCEDEGLRAVSNWHPDPDANAVLDAIYAQTDGLAEGAVEHGETVFISEVDRGRVRGSLNEIYGAFLDAYPIRSLIIVPLRVRGRTVGALAAARNRSSSPYTREDLALVKDIGQRVALAIDNARLFHIALNAQAARTGLGGAPPQAGAAVGRRDHDRRRCRSRCCTRPRRPARCSGAAMTATASNIFDHVHPDDMHSVEGAFAAAIAGRPRVGQPGVPGPPRRRRLPPRRGDRRPTCSTTTPSRAWWSTCATSPSGAGSPSSRQPSQRSASGRWPAPRCPSCSTRRPLSSPVPSTSRSAASSSCCPAPRRFGSSPASAGSPELSASPPRRPASAAFPSTSWPGCRRSPSATSTAAPASSAPRC